MGSVHILQHWLGLHHGRNTYWEAAYFGVLAALNGTNPQPPSNSTSGSFTFGDSVKSTAQLNKTTFVIGASSIASNPIWHVMLVVALFV
jgi:hypothetical protein